MAQKLYKYEMHCHCNMGSACGLSSPEEMARAYYEAGYSGMVLTDHFLLGNTAVEPGLTWEEKMAVYYKAYLAAEKAVDDPHFHVFFGIEHQYGGGKEVLTYGIDYDFLVAHPHIDRLPLGEYTELVREYGGYVAQAHPFRDRAYIDMSIPPETEHIDAVEAYNYCNHPGENEQAKAFAESHGFFMISGGDIHSSSHPGVGKAGMAFEYEITSSQELVEALKNREGRMIVDGTVV